VEQVLKQVYHHLHLPKDLLVHQDLPTQQQKLRDNPLFRFHCSLLVQYFPWRLTLANLKHTSFKGHICTSVTWCSLSKPNLA
jgi:hypothetical protein